MDLHHAREAPMKGYHVISRPAGGMKVLGALCIDGLVHLFGLIDDVPQSKPACGANVPFGKPAQGHEETCMSCAARGEAWARGGTLGTPGDES